MTSFEEFANEINVPILTDKNGFYTGITQALALEVNEVILSDDEKVFKMDWADQKELIKRRFFDVYPYMA